MRALEFYSGIGGMHYALRAALPTAQVVCAFDINNTANDVYEANFGFRPRQGTLSAVTAKQLDALQADIWLMAPPCQPYTRRGARRDVDDPRSASFLHLISLLPQLRAPPDFLLVENVVGFETSETRRRLADALAASNFYLQEFLLSPLQYGIPYSRPRYYAVARRNTRTDGQRPLQLPDPPDGRPFRIPPSHLLCSPGPAPLVPPHGTHASDVPHPHPGGVDGVRGDVRLDGAPHAVVGTTHVAFGDPHTCVSATDGADNATHAATGTEHDGDTRVADSAGYGVDRAVQVAGCFAESAAPLSRYLVASPDVTCSPATPLDGEAPDPEGDDPQQRAEAGAEGEDAWRDFRVPQRVLCGWGQTLDIVTPASHRCNCFTRTYGRYSKGSGSVLATRQLDTIRYEDPGARLAPGDLDLELDEGALAGPGRSLCAKEMAQHALDSQRLVAVPAAPAASTDVPRTGNMGRKADTRAASAARNDAACACTSNSSRKADIGTASDASNGAACMSVDAGTADNGAPPSACSSGALESQRLVAVPAASTSAASGDAALTSNGSRKADIGAASATSSNAVCTSVFPAIFAASAARCGAARTSVSGRNADNGAPPSASSSGACTRVSSRRADVGAAFAASGRGLDTTSSGRKALGATSASSTNSTCICSMDADLGATFASSINSTCICSKDADLLATAAASGGSGCVSYDNSGGCKAAGRDEGGGNTPAGKEEGSEEEDDHVPKSSGRGNNNNNSNNNNIFTSFQPPRADEMILPTGSDEENKHVHAGNGGGGSEEDEDVAAGWPVTGVTSPGLAWWLQGLGLRYFTPREIANLHSFPQEFSFPAGFPLRQQYALLGNSLSVAVVADLLTLFLATTTEEQQRRQQQQV